MTETISQPPDFRTLHTIIISLKYYTRGSSNWIGLGLSLCAMSKSGVEIVSVNAIQPTVQTKNAN